MKEEFYDKELAMEITGIKNEKLLKFHVNGLIRRIEKLIGYELAKSEITEFVHGVDTNIIYLKRKPVEQVSKALWRNKELVYRTEKHRVIFDIEICKSEEIEVTYTAGYDVLPENIQFFIFQTLKEMVTNISGLKSFSLQDVSYTYADKSQQAENFKIGIKDLFGIRI